MTGIAPGSRSEAGLEKSGQVLDSDLPRWAQGVRR